MRGIHRGAVSRTLTFVLSFVLAVGPTFGYLQPAAYADDSPPATATVESPQSVESSPTVVRELVEERTEDAKHFLLSDGTYKAEIGAGPLHYEDDAGDWQDIVTTLVPGGEPGVSSPLATKADVEFSQEIYGESAAILSGEDWSIGIDMLGASENLKIAMGNEVRYLGVAEDATLLYEAFNEGIKETVVLSGPDAPDRYEFAMALGGLEIRQTPGGGYLFYRSGTSEPVAELGALVVFDSAGPGSAGAKCPDAVMTVEACGDTAYVSYDIPRAWLDDPARVYPVKVDPTVFLRDADATPCPDTFGCEGKPTTNYSTATYLSTGKGANGQTYSYVKFPHFGTQIPAGAYIYYADLGLYQTLGTASSVHYGRVDASWAAGTLNWDNKPAHIYLGAVTTGGIGKFVIFDATATAQRWASGTSPNEGFAVFHTSGLTTYHKEFRSGNTGTVDQRPRMWVFYDLPGSNMSVTTDKAVYGIGETAAVTLRYTSAETLANLTRLDVMPNAFAGPSSRYAGRFAWFKTDPGAGWNKRQLPDGTWIGFSTAADIGAEKITPQLTQCSTTTGSNYREATFVFSVGNAWGDMQDTDFDSRALLGVSTPTYDTGWRPQDTNVGMRPAQLSAVPGATATASAGWFREVDRDANGIADNTNDLPDVGRGSMSLSWNAAPGAAGYRVYAYDGGDFRKVGETFGNASTTWSSAGGGLFPSGTELAGYANEYTGNPFARAQTPSTDTQEAEVSLSESGAGVVVSDGSRLYVRAYSMHAGPTRWKVIGSGLRGTDAGSDEGSIGPDFYSKPVRSAFHLDGAVWNGYAVTPTTIEGVSTGDTAGTATPRTMTLGGALLDRTTGAAVTTASDNVLVTAGADRIYSVASRITAGLDGFKIRAYNSNGSLVSTASPDVSVPMPSYTTDGVVCDGANLYLLESGGTSRVTKISTQTWKVVGQWTAGWAGAGIIGGCYDKANNVFWLGSYNSGKVRRYSGPGLDLRDSARGVYSKTDGTSFDARSDYRFAVVPYNSAGELAPAAANWKDVALENRTIGVNDDPRHTGHGLGDLAGDSAEVRFDTGSLELDASDLSIASWGPAAGVSRHYTSSSTAAGAFGTGWRFNFEQSVTASGAEMVYTDETGERHSFVYSAATSAWVAPNGYFATLVLSTPPIGSHYWTLTLKDRTVLTFDKLSGVLTSEADANGNQVTYTRANGDLTITAANGQTIFVDYEAGKVVSATYATPDGTRRVDYAVDGSTATVTRYPGTSCAYATTYAYTSSKLTGISVPATGASWSVTYTSPTEMTVRNTSGGTTPTMQRVFAWNATTRDATVTTFDGQTRYAWNPTGTTRLSSNEGSATLLSTYTYDGQNLLTRQVSPTGRETSQTYDSRGNTIYQWDEAGRITSFVYDGSDNPVRETDPKGATTWRTFDTRGNVTAEEKTLTASGQRSRTEYTYDSAGRTTSTRSKIDDTNWAKTDYSGFAECGEATTIIDRSVKLSPTATVVDLTRRATYDKFGNQLTETDAVNVVTASNTYDIVGRMLASTDAGGAVSNTRYDALGNTIESWRSHPQSTTKLDWRTTIYNGAGLVSVETAKASDGATVSTVSRTYDALGREIRTDDSSVAGGSQTVYDSQGNAVKSFDEGAAATDAASMRTEYNEDHEAVRSLGPGAYEAATETDYEADGQESLFRKPDGALIDYDYDSTGNESAVAWLTDEGTSTITYCYDLDGRVTASTASDGSTIVHSYDLLGRQTSSGVGSQNRSTTVYNSLGWVLSETDFDGIVRTKTYDACGRVVSDSIGGLVTTQTYDTAGRLLTKSNPDGSSVAYTYDVFGRLVSERQVATDGGGAKQETTAYDSAGRVSQTHDSFTGTTRTYTYDADGKSHLTETRPSADTTVTANVDSLGVLDSQTLRVASATVDRSLVATDVAGRVVESSSNAFNAAWRQTYDQPGRLWKQGDATSSLLSGPVWGNTSGSSICGLDPAGVGGVTYTYDPETGKKASESFGFTYQSRTETNTYTYSKTGRLVSANVAGVTTSYVYDPGTGQLTRYTRGNEPAVTLCYNALGRLTSAGAIGITHDSLGRRTAQGPAACPGAKTYTWTGERLQRFTDSQTGVVATYVYDATGQRIRSVVTQGGVTTTTAYVYDGLTLRSLAASATDGTSYSIDYAYDETGDVFAGLYRAGASAPVRFQIVTTDRGDVRELLDESGAAFAFYSYDAYGNPVSTLCSVGPGSAIPAATATAISRQPLRYASYAYDEHSGLYYLSQRYLDPATMQFISKDPARADGEESAYQYCAGEPVGKVDDSGLFAYDFHHDVTRQLIKDHFAWPRLDMRSDLIADGCDARDWVTRTYSGYGIMRYMGIWNPSHHFNMLLPVSQTAKSFETAWFGVGASDSRRTYGNDQRYRAYLWWGLNVGYNRRRALFELGLGLHAIQDCYAHGDVFFPYHKLDSADRWDDKKDNEHDRVRRARINTVGYVNKFADLVGEPRAR